MRTILHQYNLKHQNDRRQNETNQDRSSLLPRSATLVPPKTNLVTDTLDKSHITTDCHDDYFFDDPYSVPSYSDDDQATVPDEEQYIPVEDNISTTTPITSNLPDPQASKASFLPSDSTISTSPTDKLPAPQCSAANASLPSNDTSSTFDMNKLQIALAFPDYDSDNEDTMSYEIGTCPNCNHSGVLHTSCVKCESQGIYSSYAEEEESDYFTPQEFTHSENDNPSINSSDGNYFSDPDYDSSSTTTVASLSQEYGKCPSCTFIGPVNEKCLHCPPLLLQHPSTILVLMPLLLSLY